MLRFSDKTFNRRLLTLAFPIALQSLMLAAVAAGDAAMLGRVAQNEMAAVSLATQIQFLQNIFIGAVTSAGAILGAQYWGKRDLQSMREIFSMILRLTGIISLIFSALCELIPGKLMALFTHEPELISIGTEYLRIAGLSYLLTGFIECYLTMMKITDHQKDSAVISSMTVVLNLLFNSVLIFGLFGLPAMNAKGAALATLLARIIELCWALLLSRKPGFLRFSSAELLSRNAMLASDFRKCFLPLLGGSLFWGVGFTSYTAIIGHMGADAAAAASIAAVVRDLVCCLNSGIASGGSILLGNELGAGHLQQGKVYGDRLMKLSFVVGFLSTLIVLAVTPFVLHAMLLTNAAKEYLTGMMVVMSVYMIGRASNTVIINGIFGAGGDTLFDMYSLAVSMWGIAIPLALLGAFVLHWHPVVVYACTCLDEVGKIPWVLFHYHKYKWVKDLTRTRK